MKHDDIDLLVRTMWGGSETFRCGIGEQRQRKKNMYGLASVSAGEEMVGT